MTEYEKALKAGMTEESAARWPRYIGYKVARGEKPITLQQAMEQLISIGKVPSQK